MSKPRKKILAVLEDLMFRVKIDDAARRAGMDIEFTKTEEEAMDRARQQPAVIILDLNIRSVDPLRLIEQLKSDPETKPISLVSYVSHVQGDLKQAAQERGCDLVMARSAFSTNLPQLLKRHAGVV